MKDTIEDYFLLFIAKVYSIIEIAPIALLVEYTKFKDIFSIDNTSLLPNYRLYKLVINLEPSK